MSSIRNLLCAALTLGVLLAGPSAEARFGKRSRSSESTKDKVHDASAVGSDDDDDDDDDDDRGGSSGGSAGHAVVSTGSFLLDLLSVVATPSSSSQYEVTSSEAAPASDEAVDAPPEVRTAAASSITLRLGVEGSAMGGGTGMNFLLGFEGQRMGLEGRFTGLSLPTDDGTAGTDDISLGNVHLTHALIAQDRMRLRMEGGLSFAAAPDLSVAGPSLALSFEACLLSPLDVELRVQGTPFPYRQLDAQAGLALHLNVLVLRGGWRGLLLNDAGLVDDVVHQDVFGGPYLGLGLVF